MGPRAIPTARLRNSWALDDSASSWFANLIGRSRECGWETQNLLCLFSICACRLPVIFVAFALFFPTAYVLLRKYDLKHRGSDGLRLRAEKCHVTPPRADAGR